MLEKDTTAMGPEVPEQTVVKEKSDAETLSPSPPDGEQAKDEEKENKTLAVAFSMATVDRYGFLVTDK
ncbi:hypothetical protein DVH05_002876 [Phytophthora capsici]|nr:hypothetical protein DVH05_002876 [Phytophthora capsici]